MLRPRNRRETLGGLASPLCDGRMLRSCCFGDGPENGISYVFRGVAMAKQYMLNYDRHQFKHSSLRYISVVIIALLCVSITMTWHGICAINIYRDLFSGDTRVSMSLFYVKVPLHTEPSLFTARTHSLGLKTLSRPVWKLTQSRSWLGNIKHIEVKGIDKYDDLIVFLDAKGVSLEQQREIVADIIARKSAMLDSATLEGIHKGIPTEKSIGGPSTREAEEK